MNAFKDEDSFLLNTAFGSLEGVSGEGRRERGMSVI